MSNNMIFDDVFRTMLEKMPQLAIPLINEAFGTCYPEDTPIIQKRNEHETPSGEIVTDSHLFIGNKIYHIECQSTSDSTMIIRMIEYDFATALEFAQKEDHIYRMYFPQSCVLYLRGKSGAKELKMEVIMPDGSVIRYHVPVIRVANYTRDAIFQKHLLLLLPYYVMRYEQQKKQMKENSEPLNAMLAEYNLIAKQLEKSLLHEGKEKEYRDLMELIIRIADYIFSDSEAAKKGIGDVMGGKVLELQSDKLIQQGLEQGAEQEAYATARRMLKVGKYPVDEISSISGLDIAKIEKLKADENL